MFKRGDIVVHDSGILYVADGLDHFFVIDGSDDKRRRVFTDKRLFTPYTGPPYQVDGKRFVASGEFRAPREREWFRRESGSQFVGGPMIAQRNETEYRVILLPVPELPEEDPGPCMCCNGTGEVSSKCRRCGGSGNE